MKKEYIPVIYLSGLFLLTLLAIFWINQDKKLSGTFIEVPSVVESKTDRFCNFIFENSDKQEVQVASTPAECEKLRLAGPKQPTLANHKFVRTYEGYTTSSPILSDNEFYAVEPNMASSSQVKVKYPNESEKIILRSEL